jgi:hypothetical protein
MRRSFLLIIVFLFLIAGNAFSRDPFTAQQGDRIPPKLAPKTLNVFNAVVAGIIKKGDTYVALIRAADGRMYPMKVGDALFDGSVGKITANTVTFLQRVGKKNVEVTKKLHPFPRQPE